LVVRFACWHVVEQLNRTDFDDAVALRRLETSGFSI
jgi:hypothetical protein